MNFFKEYLVLMGAGLLGASAAVGMNRAAESFALSMQAKRLAKKILAKEQEKRHG